MLLELYNKCLWILVAETIFQWRGTQMCTEKPIRVWLVQLHFSQFCSSTKQANHPTVQLLSITDCWLLVLLHSSQSTEGKKVTALLSGQTTCANGYGISSSVT